MQKLKGIANNRLSSNSQHLTTKLLATGFIVATSVFIASGNALAEDPIVDEIVINVPVSCTLAGNVNTEHTDNIQNGQYSEDIGTTTLKATCNDIAGFSIYAIGFSGDKDGATNMIGTNPDNTIATGTATEGDVSNWAMKLSTNDTATYPISIENNFDEYSSVPSTYTKVAMRESTTDLGNAAIGSVLTSTYAVFVSNSQYADTYTGKVKYTLVHPASETPTQPQTPTAGCINYFANASNAVGTMGCQSVSSDGASIDLLASNFSREGYGFAGWSDAFDYATNANAHFYGPQETITAPTGTTANGLALYAVWVKSEGSIQDTSKVSSICSGLTTAPTDGTANLASVSALTDQRDNNTYAIAKLADGKCWMIENLRLESTAAHNSDGTLAQGYGTSATYGNFSGLADAESTGFSNTYSANSLYSNDGSNDTINIGTSNEPAYRMPRYNNLNTQSRAQNNPNSNSFPNNNTTGGMYSYGNYYTWSAAIADLTYNGTNNSSVANTSLCPSGWHLPKGGNKSNEANNDFWSLVVTGINGGTNPANYESSAQPYYTGSPEGSDMSKAIRAYPNNFLYSGLFNALSAYDRGSYGGYWSSTANDRSNSYRLRLNSSSVYPGTLHYGKFYGLSIRCTAGT